jgi:exonuclease VII small subunit
MEPTKIELETANRMYQQILEYTERANELLQSPEELLKNKKKMDDVRKFYGEFDNDRLRGLMLMNPFGYYAKYMIGLADKYGR